MKTQFYATLIAIILLMTLACKEEGTQPAADTSPVAESAVDPMPSWNEGPTKQAILDFVEAVTTEGSPSFVPQADRIATFDNDGNLWSEQPFYFQLQFAIDEVKKMAPDHPVWQDQQPFKALLEGDMEALMAVADAGEVMPPKSTWFEPKLADGLVSHVLD